MPKLQLILGRFVVCALFALLATVATAEDLTATQKSRLIDAIGDRLEKSAFAFGVDFSEWPTHIATHRAAIDSSQTLEDFDRAISAALAEFEVSHLTLFNPELAKLQKNGRRTGVGITVHPVENGGFVSYVLQGSPGWNCGLRKGDVITRIDGQPFVDIQQLAGMIGDTRSISWVRDDATLSGVINYSVFANAERSSMEWLTDDVALLRIQSFQRRYYNAARVNRFFREARHAKGIVLDLRNNRGGLSLYSRHLASKIAPCNAPFARVAKRRHVDDQDSIIPDLKQLAENARIIKPLPFSRPYKGELVVLVDSLSASAADIIPAFVQESGRGTVIGQKTTGALLLARPFRLPFGFKLYAPIAELLTSEGKRLERNGLVPDIALDLHETTDDSTIHSIALSVLRRNTPQPE